MRNCCERAALCHWLQYYKTLYFHCIFISQFWCAEILLHFNLAFPNLRVSIRPLMGKLNFHGCLISQFSSYLFGKLMHVNCENVRFTVLYTILLCMSNTAFHNLITHTILTASFHLKLG